VNLFTGIEKRNSTQFFHKVIYTSRKSQGWLSIPIALGEPRFALGQKPDIPRLFHARRLSGFMTFTLDQNPVCSMVRSSKLTGGPDAKISP
jgi:hypothetical protein